MSSRLWGGGLPVAPCSNVPRGSFEVGRNPGIAHRYIRRSKCAFKDVRARGVLLLRERRRPFHARRWGIPPESLRVFLRLRGSRRAFGWGRGFRETREYRRGYPGFWL